MFDRYPDWEYTLASIQLIAFMLAMGAKLSWAQFSGVLRQPRSLLVALAGHLFLIPLVAFAINQAWGLEPGPAVGLILVAAMPGGTLAKIFTYLGHGNVALSIALSVVSTMLTLVTVPVLLGLLATDIPNPMDPAVALWVIREMTLFLLLPLAAGMLLGHWFPHARQILARWGTRIGLAIVVVMVTGALGSGRITPGSHGWGVPLAIIVFCMAGQQLNQIPFYLFRWPRQDRMAAGIEVTMRNMNLALLLHASLFARLETIGPGVLFVILFYAAVAMIAAVPLALRHRWMGGSSEPRTK